MSARAAWRFEALGFDRVDRYQPGKDDWIVARLPLEGTDAGIPHAADVARRDVPVCGLRDRVREVADAVRAGNWPLAVVLDERRVAVGRLRARDLGERPDAVAEEIMVDGPRTIRGTRPASEMGGLARRARRPGVLVTTADGELIGYVRRNEV